MKNPEAVKRHYETHAKYYEEWQGPLQGGYHFGFPKKFLDILSNSRMVQNLTDQVIKELDARPGQKIFDAGCGRGQILERIIAKYPNHQLDLYGSTLSDIQYESSKAHFKEKHNIQIFLEDFDATHFSDSFFDRVFFVDAFCYGDGSSKEKTLKEAHRILKLGGKIVICDVFLKDHPEKFGKVFQKLNTKTNQAWAVEEWAVEPDFLREAEKLGFKKVHEIQLQKKIAFSVAHLTLRWLPTSIIRSMYDASFNQARKTLMKLGIFAPLLGIHRGFQYKIVVLEKVS